MLLTAALWPGMVRAYEEGNYRVVDTGIEQTTLTGSVLGLWLDNHRMLLNALRDEPDVRKSPLERVVIYDTKTRAIRTVVPAGRIVCYSDKPHFARLVVDGVEQFVTVDASDRLVPLPDPPKTKTFLCREDGDFRQDRLQILLRPGDGYIDRGPTGGGFSREPAVLHRPDGTVVELPMQGGEIHLARYLPHLGRYLLDDADNLSGHVQPAGRPVFYLMTPEGQVDEIPQPRQFVSEVGGFGEMHLMRDGMILNRTGPARKNAGLFFLKENRIIRVFGADGTIATHLHSSPDGCSLAFLALKNYNYATRKTVRTIDLCREE